MLIINSMITMDRKTLTVKEKISYLTAICALAMGFSLSIAGFCVPPLGEISDSVLWIMGQAFLYSGAILGISSHYSAELDKFKHSIDEKIKQENHINNLNPK